MSMFLDEQSGPYRVEWPLGDVEMRTSRRSLLALLEMIGPDERAEVVVTAPTMPVGDMRTDDGAYVYDLLTMEIESPLWT